jgi:uncharacterized cupin superfamily protein
METAPQDIWFENSFAGQRSRIVELPAVSGGKRFVLEYVNRPYGGENAVPSHVHTVANETFEILRGRAKYQLGRTVGTAGPGDRVEMPAGVPHKHPWSDSGEELHVRQIAEVDPADLRGLNASLQAAVTIQGLARAGKVSPKGLPNLLQLGVLLASTMPATYLDGPPIALQRMLFGLLGHLGRVAGYRTAYPEYGMITPFGLKMPQP